MPGDVARVQRLAGASANQVLLLGKSANAIVYGEVLNGQLDCALDNGHQIRMHALQLRQ